MLNKMWNKKQIIELPLMISFFGLILVGSLDTNFIIYRTCYVVLDNNETECFILGSNRKDNSSDKLELKVEPYSNIIIMVWNISNGIVSATTGLFVGPWSDKHGRKPIMLIALLGIICSFILKIIVVLIPRASPWLLLSQILPTLFSGGFSTFMMISMCYIVDITTKEEVGTRIGFVEIVIAISLITANAISSFLFNATGYSTVFLIGLAVEIIALLSIYLFIEDTIKIEKEKQDDKKIFCLAQIKDTMNTVSKCRPNNQKKTLYILFVISLLNSIIMSHMSIMFPFMRVQFKWTLEKFTLFSSIYAVINIAGTFFGIYVLHKLLKLSEISLLFIVYVNHTVACIFVINATSDTFLIIGLGLQFLNGLLAPMVRSLVSKMVPNEEVGKIFSFAHSIEALAGLIATPVFTFIYNSTIDKYPATFYIIDTIIYGVNILLVIAIWRIFRDNDRTSLNSSRSELMHNDSACSNHLSG